MEKQSKERIKKHVIIWDEPCNRCGWQEGYCEKCGKIFGRIVGHKIEEI